MRLQREAEEAARREQEEREQLLAQQRLEAERLQREQAAREAKEAAERQQVREDDGAGLNGGEVNHFQREQAEWEAQARRRMLELEGQSMCESQAQWRELELRESLKHEQVGCNAVALEQQLDEQKKEVMPDSFGFVKGLVAVGAMLVLTIAAWQGSKKPQIEPEMVSIPRGTFTMGCVSGVGCRSDEKPLRDVTVPAFEMGKYEVTFTQWDECVKQKGCQHKPDDIWGRGDQPVINVSWIDAQEYVGWLSEKTGKKYRLPTEAEWEYAARAGTKTPFFAGNCIFTYQANYNGNYGWDAVSCPKTGNYRGKTMSVVSFAKNDFGLSNMYGNVSEWVRDLYHNNYDKTPKDGSLPAGGLVLSVIVCCVVVPGTSNQFTCVLLPVTRTHRGIVSATLDFVWPGHFNFFLCAFTLCCSYYGVHVVVRSADCVGVRGQRLRSIYFPGKEKK